MMGQMRTIEIDFDVHQMIELERRGFEEKENDALRRLLKLELKATTSDPAPNDKLSQPQGVKNNEPLEANDRRSWSGKGVELPHGTELRMEYNGQIHRGAIGDGYWVVDGVRSTSPSDAAGSVATTKNGTRPSLNGWIYWEVKRPSDAHWRALKSLKLRK